MTTTPQPSTSSVTTAAKRPAKTKTFLARICTALVIFDDQISSLDKGRTTAYETFVTAYKEAFAEIWPKIEGADVTILLQSVKDTELQELRRLSQILCPDKARPTLMQEKHNVPTLDNILGGLVNRIPEQKLPDKETCSLIADIFSDQGISRHRRPRLAQTTDTDSCHCCPTDIATRSATWSNLAAIHPATTPRNINYTGRPTGAN